MERNVAWRQPRVRLARSPKRRRIFPLALLVAAVVLVYGTFFGNWGHRGGEGGRPDRGRGQDPAPVVAVAPPELPTTAPTTQTSEPASYLYMEYKGADGAVGAPKAFPPARLLLNDKKDGPVVALLFSDDPKEALSQQWGGDRYYLEMRLQANSVAHLDGEQWGTVASPGELPETTNGIYLKGDRYHLVPVNVLVRFEGKAPNLTVRLAGQFLQTDTMDPTSPPRNVMVQGVLMPKVEIK